MKPFLEKILAFLRVRTVAVGLEVTDQVLRLVYFDGKVWQLHAVRLEAGILENGRIKNRPAFLTALAALKAKLTGREKKKMLNVVLCLSSLQGYTQTLSLPTTKGESLEEAVSLNLRMASPIDADRAYSDWERLGRDEATFQDQVLAAFMEREPVDEMVATLFEAGFLTMAVESHALSIARVLREKGAGVDISKPYIFANIDNIGIDFLIVRGGALYFEYAEPWHDLADDKGEVSVEKFKEALGATVRQVVNFYQKHWPEPLTGIVFSSAVLDAEAEAAIVAASPAPVMKLTLQMGQTISSEWLAALGSSLRGSVQNARGKEISLLGEESQDLFHEEQLLGFLSFWRVVIPVVLGLLLITFGVSDVFLKNTRTEIESRSDFSLGSGQAAEIASLKASAEEFNAITTLIASVERTQNPKSVFLERILALANANHITIARLTFSSLDSPISLSGTGMGQTDVVAFKTAIENDSKFNGVDLPLTGVQTFGDNVSFAMTFNYRHVARPGSAAGEGGIPQRSRP